MVSSLTKIAAASSLYHKACLLYNSAYKGKKFKAVG